MSRKKPARNQGKLFDCLPSKRCSRCGVVQPVSEFRKRSDRPNSLRSPCKTCIKKYVQSREKEVAEYQKRYRQLHAEERKEYVRRYGKENSSRLAAYHKAWAESPEGRAWRRKYNKLHPVTPEQNAKRYLLHVRHHRLKKRYGLTADDYDRLMESQDGRCAICDATESTHKRSTHLHVDHCHKTGRVRGLLCSRCNRAIGFFQDNPELLRKAITYLKKSKNKHASK